MEKIILNFIGRELPSYAHRYRAFPGVLLFVF